MLTIYDLWDQSYMGNPFTQCNNRDSDQKIFERLDKFLANSSWCDLFPNGCVRHCYVAYSVHYPIALGREGTIFQHCGTKSFKFEALWVGKDACSNIIEQTQAECGGMASIEEVKQINERCEAKLQQWNKTSFGNV